MIDNLLVLFMAISLTGTAFWLIHWYLNEVVSTEIDRVNLDTENRLYASMLKKIPQNKIRW
jgi:hypothetical protein